MRLILKIGCLWPPLRPPRAPDSPACPPPWLVGGRSTKDLRLLAGGKIPPHTPSLSQRLSGLSHHLLHVTPHLPRCPPEALDTPQSDHPFSSSAHSELMCHQQARVLPPPHPRTSPAPSCAKTWLSPRRCFPAAPQMQVLSFPPIMPLGLEGAPPLQNLLPPPFPFVQLPVTPIPYDSGSWLTAVGNCGDQTGDPNSLTLCPPMSRPLPPFRYIPTHPSTNLVMSSNRNPCKTRMVDTPSDPCLFFPR